MKKCSSPLVQSKSKTSLKVLVIIFSVVVEHTTNGYCDFWVYNGTNLSQYCQFVSLFLSPIMKFHLEHVQKQILVQVLMKWQN